LACFSGGILKFLPFKEWRWSLILICRTAFFFGAFSVSLAGYAAGDDDDIESQCASWDRAQTMAESLCAAGNAVGCSTLFRAKSERARLGCSNSGTNSRSRDEPFRTDPRARQGAIGAGESTQGGVYFSVYCSASYLGAPETVYQTPVFRVKGYERSDWRFQGLADYHMRLFDSYAKENLKQAVGGVGASRCGFFEESAVAEKYRRDEAGGRYGLRIITVDYERPAWIPPAAPLPSNRTTQ
jgi:hypothetical protein